MTGAAATTGVKSVFANVSSTVVGDTGVETVVAGSENEVEAVTDVATGSAAVTAIVVVGPEPLPPPPPMYRAE